MKDVLAFIEHILLCIKKIQDSVIRNLEIIGEATKKISKELKSQSPDIPWKEMSGMRDKLIHDYFGVDVDVVWKTVNDDIPFLKSLIETIDK